MLYPCMFCVALSMDLFVLCVARLTVFVNCSVKQFAICLGVFAILLLKVMEVCVVGGALLDRPCMVFHRMCVLCLWPHFFRCSLLHVTPVYEANSCLYYPPGVTVLHRL